MLICEFVLNNAFFDSTLIQGLCVEEGLMSSFCPKEVLGAVGVGYLLYQGYRYIYRPSKHIFPNGDLYEGYLVNGKKEGKGKLTFSNGDYYEGNFANDKMEGKGKYVCFNGDCYEGDFVNDKAEGRGKLTFFNGDCYEGDFVDDRMEGKGKYTYRNGDCYEGDFVNDEGQGRGKFTLFNGNCYEGNFVHDKMEGKGKVTCPNGDCYVGEWKNDTMVSSNIGNLGDDLFFALLCGTSQMCPPNGYCLGIVLDYLQIKGYEEVADALREACRYLIMSPEEIEKESCVIYNELNHEKKSKLICYGFEGHEMGLNLVPNMFPGFIVCEIFNSGEGLVYHERHPLFRRRYKFMLQVKVPVESLTSERIKTLLLSVKLSQDMQQAYGHILNLPGANILPSSAFPWQLEQEDHQCSLLWILNGYCERKMSKPQQMREQMKKDCKRVRSYADLDIDL